MKEQQRVCKELEGNVRNAVFRESCEDWALAFPTAAPGVITISAPAALPGSWQMPFCWCSKRHRYPHVPFNFGEDFVTV